MSELPKNYDPASIEDTWYRWWVEKGLFHSDASRGGKPYCIVIPPPNVTGILHMGHALNNTIQDVLVRWKRMQGFNTVWVPGTDHAGIATQNVVEKQLKKEHKTRDDLGREAFVERVWAWRGQYGATIINQLKKLGASCDWDRERFTMDEGLSNAVAEVFVRLYEKGLIYRGKYIINWCPRCRTALSDEESEHEDLGGKLYHIRYPFVDASKGHVTVATTRPETLLGDTAVAVNPADERFKHLVGQKLRLPVLNREIPIIADDFVDPKFGTGLVKVTPAHDPNDFGIGQRHHLAQIDVMNDDGSMNDEAGPYAGMDRFACREEIVEDLKDAGLIDRIEDHHHAVGHCYRCHTMVEPRLSPQWFVKMKPLAGPAAEAVRTGRIRFVPERWTKVYLDWMDNIRDWCISRQIWWGHRIPVFYCDDCGHTWAAKGQPGKCPKCASAKIRQDEDVLDTWFSSWLWPFSVFGWPEKSKDLAFYYPTNSLVTASEIIFFWVARMIMAGLEFMGDIPFSEVYIHGTVRDDTGLKMSKSLGNSIDPLDIITKYSADALRFSLMMLTATGQDVYVSAEKFELGRNFGTKIWNAARYLQMNGKGEAFDGMELGVDAGELSPDDMHLLVKLDRAIADCDDNLAKLRVNDYAKTLYEFLWHQFCDWYVEYSKAALNGSDAQRRAAVLRVMHYVFSRAVRLIQPLMPHLAEELWHSMGYHAEWESVMAAEWPKVSDEWKQGRFVKAAEYVDAKHETITLARALTAEFSIPPSQKMAYAVRVEDAGLLAQVQADRAGIVAQLRAQDIAVSRDFKPPKAMPSVITPLGTVYLSLEGVDVAAELKRLAAQMEKAGQDLARVTKQLENEAFVSKAKPEAVDAQRARKVELEEKRDKLAKLMEMLKGK